MSIQQSEINMSAKNQAIATNGKVVIHNPEKTSSGCPNIELVLPSGINFNGMFDKLLLSSRKTELVEHYGKRGNVTRRRILFHH